MERFDAPTLGANSDAGKCAKLASKVLAILNTSVNKEPRRLDPRSLLVSPQNRDGAPPNVQHVHHGILRSLKNHGFDPSRPAVGICIQAKSPEAKAKLLEYNRRFSVGNPLLPPIHEDLAMYGTLAASHLNVALRLIQAGTASPACDIGALAPPGSALAEVVESGHRWWILPEDTSLDAQISVSLWRNQDQNENQATHEIELLRTIMAVCANLSVVKSSMALGDIVAHAQQRTPAMVSQTTLFAIARFYTKFLENGSQHLAHELVDFHASRVNPRELAVSTNYFGTLASEVGLQRAPHTRHYLLLANYCKDKLRGNAGSASVSNFIETNTVIGLSKKPDIVECLENLLVEGRKKFLPLLERQLSPAQARLEFFEYAQLLVRCTLGKALPEPYSRRGSPGGGKLLSDKGELLAAAWAEEVHKRYPDLDFPKVAGLASTENLEEGARDTVRLEELQSDAAAAADAARAAVPSKLKVGDHVTVTRRFTWSIPLPGRENYRKDIEEKTEGIVKGYADEHLRQVLVEIELSLPEASGTSRRRKHTAACWPRNLALTSEYEALKAAAGDEAVEPEDVEATSTTDSGRKLKHRVPPGFSFVYRGIPEDLQTRVVIESKWDKYLDNSSSFQLSYYLKGRIAFGMQILERAVPPLGPADVAVVHRETSKGAYKTEVWTRRRFAPREFLVPCVSSETRDCLWTKHTCAFVGLPANGSGRHPEGKLVALDGRHRGTIAGPGHLEEKERRGCLFWAIERTSDIGEANLSLEQISWSTSCEVNLPGGKKRKAVVDIEAGELPAIPILMNEKAIPEHTRLIARAEILPAVGVEAKGKPSSGASSSSKSRAG